MKLPTAEQMRKLDETAINRFGIPSIVLMENAGRGSIETLLRNIGDPVGQIVTIFVGPGNNGGDGLVIARHLHQKGARPQVILLADPQKLSGDPAVNLAIVNKLPVPVYPVASGDDLDELEEVISASWAVVDSIFGTGLKREVSGHYAEAINLINQLGCPVMAVDVPSGLDSDSGQPLGFCVQADCTATFGLAKPGLIPHQPGSRFVGVLEIIDIGIPPQAVEESAIQTEWLTRQVVAEWLVPRHTSAHKGSFGHLLVVAGSTGKSGAAALCATGALRSGAGLVTVAAPRKLNRVLETLLIEAMTLPLPKSKHHLCDEDWETISTNLDGKTALAIGPGTGTDPETAKLVKKIYLEAKAPMVVDADGLNCLADDIAILKKAAAPRILTPHPGEMARLTKMKTVDIQANRLKVASDFAKKHGIVLVLKGAGTVIAGPDGRIAINSTGNPGMASGGTGDVLAGLIGGLLAQGLAPWQAACLSVYAHGLAGDLLAEENGVEMGYLASELAQELPMAFEEIANQD